MTTIIINQPNVRPTILPRELQHDTLAIALAKNGVALWLIDQVVERAALGEFDKGLSRHQAEREACRYNNVAFPFQVQSDPAFSPPG